jgi:phytoene dehydrogenase-like protein
MSTFDTVILGSSPNALTAAAYLARAGQRVLVLEPSDRIGGAVDTREFAPGFKADFGLTAGRLDTTIVSDLKLYQHGLEVIERNSITSLLSGGRSFTLSSDVAAATEVIRGFAPADAEKYGKFNALLQQATEFLRSMYSMTPQSHPPSPEDANKLMALASKLRGYGNREMTEVMRLLVMSVRDLLEEWFQTPELKGVLGSAAIRGLTQGPFGGGTTFNLLHHLAINDGYFRATARGGIGAISQALAAAAKAGGVEIRTSIGGFTVSLKDGVATGVTLKSGEQIAASTVVSDFDARQTFRNLLDASELEPEFNRAVQRVKYNGAVARVNLALSGLPDFVDLTKDALKGTLVVAPSVAYLEKAFDATKYAKASEQPYLEVTIPTVCDETLAPAGKHVMSIWVQYSSYRSATPGQKVLDLVLDKLSEFAPNLKSLVTHSEVVTPQDFEHKLHLSEGHLYGGDMTLTQAFFLRPIPGFAQYKTPIEQLFLCGAATHPGGGVSGLGGKNAVQAMGVKDLAVV